MKTIRIPKYSGKRWLPKSRKVYMLDENGQRIRLPSGAWKTYKARTTDWDDHGNAEIWRSAWADSVNRHLERNGCRERLDLRSYQRQGKETAPTVHLGPAAAHLEEKGVPTQIGDYNRSITAYNRKMVRLQEATSDTGAWIDGAEKKLKAIRLRTKPRTLRDFAEAFLALQKQGKAKWGLGAPEGGETEFPEAVAGWMQAHQVFTLKEFRGYVDARKDVLRRLEALGKEIGRLDTALKHIMRKSRSSWKRKQSGRGKRWPRRKRRGNP